MRGIRARYSANIAVFVLFSAVLYILVTAGMGVGGADDRVGVLRARDFAVSEEDTRVAVVAVMPEKLEFGDPEVGALISSVPEWRQTLGIAAIDVLFVFPTRSIVDEGFATLTTMDAGRISFSILQPCKTRSRCRPLMSFSDLANYGYKRILRDTSHILFLSLVLSVSPSLLPSMVLQMSPSENVGAIGCTILAKAEGNNPPKVLEHGIHAGNGWSRGQWVPHLLRKYHGFPSVDRRVRGEVSEVLAVSPYCMLTYRGVFDRFAGFRKYAPSLREQMELGRVPLTFMDVDLKNLKAKHLMLHSLSRQLTTNTNSEITTARTNADIALQEGLVSIGKVEGKIRRARVEAMAKTVANVDVGSDGEALQKLGVQTKEYEGLLRKVQDMFFTDGVAGQQEEGGWDFCMRLNKHKMTVLVSNATAIMTMTSMPLAIKPVHTVDVMELGVLVPPSFSVNGAFKTQWGDAIRDSWPGEQNAYSSFLVPDQLQQVFRVIWQSFCCHCCGFANEILHLVFPLQQKHAIDLVPGPECFCQGYPTAVLDTLSRMHIPDRQLDAPVRHDEIVIWVSHTDPGSYLTDPLVKKRPNYVVGRSMYEFTKIPPRWVNECRDNADEVWVPSAFVRDVWIDNGIAPEKVVLIPESVDMYFFDPDVAGKLEIPFSNDFLFYDSRSERPVKQVEKEYKFLSHFKWEDRKGWDVLYEAYFSSFTPEDDVVLIVLTHIWFPGPPETHGDPTNHTLIREIVHKLAKDRLNKKPEELPHFIVLTSRMPEEDVAALYNSVDGFILPTRGEGWGLPPLQAMSMGVPTATTNWSGTVDFLNPEVSFPIRIDGIAEIPKDSYYGYVEGKKWALPSLEDTKRIMKIMQAPSNRESLRNMGSRARQYVADHFSEEVIAEIVSKRIEDIKDIILNNKVPPRKNVWY